MSKVDGKMTAEEFEARRVELLDEGKKIPVSRAKKTTKKAAKKTTKKAAKKKVVKSPTNARDFILNRAQEKILVPVGGPDGTLDIEIRACLTKKEIQAHRKFIEMFQNPEDVSEVEADEGAAKFLAAITIDKSLDEEFWSRDDIDSYIAQELLIAFMSKAAEVMKGVQKFRNK